jgi:hypothetical protein
MKSKYLKGFFLLTLVLLTCISVASATDALDDTTRDVVETPSITTEQVETSTISDVQASDNIEKTIPTKNIKQQTRTNHPIDDDADFNALFISPDSNNIYELSTSVSNGDDITFNTDISRTGKTYIINKEVNIIGNDKTITLNTVSGSYFGNETGSSFIFDNGAAHSTVTNLNFYNTQVIVRNTTEIVFDNIDQIVSNQNIGQGIGAFSIRADSSYITVENSRFSTTNNGGSSTLVLASANHCTINNNNITATGNVGNLLYLTTYNIEGVSLTDIELNSYNTISNNILTGTPNIPAICYGIALTGHDNNILYNTVSIASQGITTQWAYTDPATPEIGDNSERYKGNTYTGNVLTNGASFKATNNSTITYNTLNAVTLVENCTFIGNTATSVSVTAKNNYFCSNTIGTLNVGASATNTSVCECNIITTYLDTTGNIVPVSCEDCDYCGDEDVESLPANTKILKGDDDNTFVYNVTKENFYDIFMITELDDERIATFPVDQIGNYTIYLDYVPSNITRISFPQNANTRKSNLTVIGVNNLTLNDKYITVPTQFNRIVIANFTYNFENSSQTNALYITPSNTYVKAGVLIENITINSYKNLDIDPESTLPDNLRFITPIQIRTYTNKDNAIPILVNNVTINMKTESYIIDWDKANKPYTIPFYMDAMNYNNSNVTVTNCNINFNETAVYDDTKEYSTIWGAYLLRNTVFANNIINISGSQCVYGIVARGSNLTIENNTINSKSTGYYADGINVESQNIRDVYIANNIINVTAGYGENGNQNPHVAYGALILDYSYKGYKYVPNEYSIENVSYINNTIICDAGQSYGVEIYGGNNLNISDNNITLTSRVPMGIGAIGENVTISGNTIVANGTNNGTESTVDYLTSRTVGVYTRFTSVGINIINNTINTTTGRAIFIDHSNNTVSYDNTVNVENYTNTVEINVGTGNTVTENYLISPELKGDESVFDYKGTDNIIENNLPKIVKEYSLVVDTTEFTPGQTANIIASIYYGTESSKEVAQNISKGKISFKVNGKTLKDENGKVIYAKVVNGVATIENYEIPENWTQEGTTIQAVYSGSTDLEKLTSDKTELTITATEPTITTEDVTATVGATVTLKATINTDATINTGKVVFKINGKTVKDANGKVIYAKVSNNEVTVEYTLPESYKAGTYTLTAVFISPDYDRIEDTKTLTVN